MEPKTDINRPSTIRIIAGSLVLLCIFPIFGICVYGMYYLLELYPARKFSIFEHFWGKLLIIFISGIIFLISIGILVSLVLVAVKIWMGKSRMMKHVIYPFPTVLTAELADAMKVERADDEFFIFNRHSLIRGTLIVTGGILSCVGIITIGVEMNDPFSEVYLASIQWGNFGIFSSSSERTDNFFPTLCIGQNERYCNFSPPFVFSELHNTFFKSCARIFKRKLMFCTPSKWNSHSCSWGV